MHLTRFTFRSEFEGLLEKAPSEANSFLADPEKYIAGIRANPDAAAREQMEKVVGLLVDDRCVDGKVWGGSVGEKRVGGQGGWGGPAEKLVGLLVDHRRVDGELWEGGVRGKVCGRGGGLSGKVADLLVDDRCEDGEVGGGGVGEDGVTLSKVV